MSYMETYREWCTNPYFSEETRAELEAIKDCLFYSGTGSNLFWRQQKAEDTDTDIADGVSKLI